MRELDFRQNKVEVLTLDELAQTAHEDYHNGLPVMGIYHWQLIQALLESLEKANVKYEVQEIFAANNNSKDRPGVTIERRIAEEKGGNVLEAYTLNQGQMNNGIERYLLKAQEYQGSGESMTFWEALQCFNYDLKPGLCEIPSIVGQNVSLTELFLQEMYK